MEINSSKQRFFQEKRYIAGQSISQPATKMTLNIFHFDDIYVKNDKLDVSILKEIINVFKRLKSPSITIYLTPEILRNKKN